MESVHPEPVLTDEILKEDRHMSTANTTTAPDMRPKRITGMWLRRTDAGNCYQRALVIDGVIRAQWLSAGYTGAGNPEWVGQPIRDVEASAGLYYDERWSVEHTLDEWDRILEA